MLNRTTRLVLLAVVLILPVQAFSQVATHEDTYQNFFFLEDFHTYDYASVVDFYNPFWGPDGDLGGCWMDRGDTWSWNHTLPANFSVPPYQVEAATLWIDAEWVDRNGNSVQINGLLNWDALNRTWFDNSSYDLLANPLVDDDFWNAGNGFLNVGLHAVENLRIDQVVLMMDYDVDQSQASTVPEPASLLLLGLGLAGAAAYRIRRRK